MANWESKNISDVVKDIDDRKFVLPVIQRRLVWEEEKMELLFDTLLRGDSFGGVMVIREDKNTQPLFPFRPFTKDGESIPSAEVDTIPQQQSFVVDGQQRLQTFYIGLTGTINGKILYFDLFSNYNGQFEFQFEGDFSKLPRQAKEDSSKLIRGYKWYPVNVLFNELNRSNNDRIVARNIIASGNIIDDQEKFHIEENVAAFYRNIFSGKTLGISEVAIDKVTFDEVTNRQRIVELFRRLNDGGTKLSPFDLVASIFKGFDWRMEKFLEETIAEYSDIGLNQDNLIKLIFLLQDNHRKEMTNIDAIDAKFAINNKERIISSLIALRKFLQASDLYNYYKEGNRSFIPLYFVLYHIFHKELADNEIENFFKNYDANNSEFPRIKKWIYYSLINGVFKSKGAGWIPYKTGIRKLLDEIKGHKNKEFPTDDLFDVYYEHGVTFTETFDASNLDGLDSQFLFYLMYDRKMIIRVQDIDHIMPKSILEGLNYEWPKINSIRNYQLIDYGTNRGDKNASPFKDWIDTLPDKKSFVKSHLIPLDESLWLEAEFEKFIEAREKLILNKITSYMGE
ncbi:uncharacterized protein DUF1524 [Chitinophaga skermanii]|uniref:Uncharacterized protein DUF1524 n=1 Tax=Chitinophaga skermanii TaxID=331697 RepID=A0A327R4D9_9BACT|nr:DUF262 domain-containing protein [Chitinophaga skermanii]RAJ11075.1 uncharacterized protein DUF1524 [Chitinophaga skermanii]